VLKKGRKEDWENYSLVSLTREGHTASPAAAISSHVKDRDDRTHNVGKRSMESWNHSGWETPLRSSSQPNTTRPTKPCPKVPQLHGFCNPSRDGDSTTALGSLFQCLTTLPVKKFFPNIQSAPPPMQLEAIAYCPITWEKRPPPASLQPPFR